MKKSTKGALLLALGILLFIGYWVVLLEPVQVAYAGTGSYPSLALCIAAAVIVGVVIATLTFVGNALLKDKAFGIEHTDPTFEELKEAKAFTMWAICWVVAFLILTLIWRGEL